MVSLGPERCRTMCKCSCVIMHTLQLYSPSSGRDINVQVVPRSKPLPNYKKIVLHCALKPDNEIKFLRKITVTVAVILSVGIKYSLRDLLCDVINYALLPATCDTYDKLCQCSI